MLLKLRYFRIDAILTLEAGFIVRMSSILGPHDSKGAVGSSTMTNRVGE